MFYFISCSRKRRLLKNWNLVSSSSSMTDLWYHVQIWMILAFWERSSMPNVKSLLYVHLVLSKSKYDQFKPNLILSLANLIEFSWLHWVELLLTQFQMNMKHQNLWPNLVLMFLLNLNLLYNCIILTNNKSGH